jgi:ubiquinone/menaquinone biosynthesis C-methylase UbiE
MQQIDIKEVAKKYNGIETVWDSNDKWHLITHKMIKDFIWSASSEITQWHKLKILNAGSCGYSYGLDEQNITHIDIAEQKLVNIKNAIVGSIEDIPLSRESIDMIICVGSVLNYCDPVKVLSEFKRVLAKDGYLILEFENSRTFELLGKSSFNKRAALVETFYHGQKEKLWFFAESYIRELGELNGFEITKIARCHILSPLVYRFSKNENFASKYSKWDHFCSRVPYLRNFSSNTVFLLRKQNVTG